MRRRCQASRRQIADEKFALEKSPGRRNRLSRAAMALQRSTSSRRFRESRTMARLLALGNPKVKTSRWKTLSTTLWQRLEKSTFYRELAATRKNN
jgi:hypothetical protein